MNVQTIFMSVCLFGAVSQMHASARTLAPASKRQSQATWRKRMDDLGARLARFEEQQRYASLEKASDKNAHNVQIVHESLNQLIAYHKKELVPSCRRLREHASALRNAYSCMAAMVREEVARQTAHGNANTRTFALQVYDR